MKNLAVGVVLTTKIGTTRLGERSLLDQAMAKFKEVRGIHSVQVAQAEDAVLPAGLTGFPWQPPSGPPACAWTDYLQQQLGRDFAYIVMTAAHTPLVTAGRLELLLSLVKTKARRAFLVLPMRATLHQAKDKPICEYASPLIVGSLALRTPLAPEKPNLIETMATEAEWAEGLDARDPLQLDHITRLRTRQIF